MSVHINKMKKVSIGVLFWLCVQAGPIDTHWPYFNDRNHNEGPLGQAGFCCECQIVVVKGGLSCRSWLLKAFNNVMTLFPCGKMHLDEYFANFWPPAGNSTSKDHATPTSRFRIFANTNSRIWEESWRIEYRVMWDSGWGRCLLGSPGRQHPLI